MFPNGTSEEYRIMQKVINHKVNFEFIFRWGESVLIMFKIMTIVDNFIKP